MKRSTASAMLGLIGLFSVTDVRLQTSSSGNTAALMLGAEAQARVERSRTARSVAGHARRVDRRIDRRVDRRAVRRVARRTAVWVATLPVGCVYGSYYGSYYYKCGGIYYVKSGGRYVQVVF